MEGLVDSLNTAQRSAVEHVEGPLLILAGPGSGKTRVVTHRIANLLRQGIHDWQIVALTFTNKAADEMRRRVEELVPQSRVWISTFHRFGARMLRQYGEYVGLAQNFTIYDTSASRELIRRVMDANDIFAGQYSPDRIAKEISSLKNKLITPDKFEPKRGRPIEQVVSEIYPAYQQELLRCAAVDFDDLLLHLPVMLYQNAELRAQLDERFRYLLVDEYQDTNRAQYVLLRALAVDYPNLAVTGDPDQSIYGWRGANVNNILEFEQDYPTAQVVRLEQNYRSSQRILAAADVLIANNVHRKEKRLLTENDEGLAVKIVTYANETHEADAIAEEIGELIASGKRRPSDFAIFYRVNALSRTLEASLRGAGIPFQMVRGQEFFARKEIKDVLAYAQLLNNPRDDIALLRVINTPARGIGRKTIERVSQYARSNDLTLLQGCREAGMVPGLSKRAATLVAKFVAIMDRLGESLHGPVEELLRQVLKESGYQATLQESNTEEDAERLENIEELLTDAAKFDNDHEGPDTLEAYLERSWLVNETDDWDARAERVSLMTLHAAKGLEFPVVYVVAVEHNLLPHERSQHDPLELEEERRLLFVGMTRAEEQLQISCTAQRSYRGRFNFSIPSEFLREVAEAEVEVLEPAPRRSYDIFEAAGLPPQVPEDAFNPPVPVANAQKERQTPKKNVVREATIQSAATLYGNDSAEQTTTSSAKRRKKKNANDDPPAGHDFREGMPVTHPEYGLGKIKSLSGTGRNRRAVVLFATSGEKNFVLAHAPLRPAGGS